MGTRRATHSRIKLSSRLPHIPSLHTALTRHPFVHLALCLEADAEPLRGAGMVSIRSQVKTPFLSNCSFQLRSECGFPGKAV